MNICYKMVNSRLIIASLSNDEAITNCILNNKTKMELDIKVLLIDELLTKYEINDELSDDGALIRWIDEGGKIISNKNSMLLNRVTHVPDDMFKKFVKQDRLYAKNEFESYLGFAFNAFRGVGNSSYDGICVMTNSLPEQWLKMKSLEDIAIPVFYWGPKQFNYLENQEGVVYSEIGNLLNWRDCYDVGDDKHVFCFKRPVGMPVFSFNIGTKTMIHSCEELTEDLRERISELSVAVNEKFHYFISEILFFIDKNKISFGCVNHEIVQARKDLNFERFVCEHLTREYMKCLS